MPKKFIRGGYILLSRRLIESEIWDKPPMYLKVWIYILTKARHKAADRYSRGEMLISIPELQEACSHRVGYRVEKPKKHEIDNILRWLRRAGEGQHGYDSEEHTNTPMITTTKTTRGMVVKVHNYNVYQDPKNYEYDSEYDNENDNATTAHTTMLRQGSDTIHKNVKNVEEGNNANNENNDTRQNQIDKLFEMHSNLGYGIAGASAYAVFTKYLDEGFTTEMIERAYQIGASSNNKRQSYINGIFDKWKKNGLKTIEDVDNHENKRRRQVVSQFKSNSLDDITEEDILGG